MDLGTAAVVAAIVLAASVMSIEAALSVAVVEIVLGLALAPTFNAHREVAQRFRTLAFGATSGCSRCCSR